MSSHRAAAASTAKVARTPKARGRRVTKSIEVPTASAEAVRLAFELDQVLKSGRIDHLTPDALQALMSALCKTYATQP